MTHSIVNTLSVAIIGRWQVTEGVGAYWSNGILILWDAIITILILPLKSTISHRLQSGIILMSDNKYPVFNYLRTMADTCTSVTISPTPVTFPSLM